jgi:hypothetical protein
MSRIQGFIDDGVEQYVYQESDDGTSAGYGIDTSSNSWALSVLTTPGAYPTDLPVIQCYPSGNIVLIPGGVLQLIGDQTVTDNVTLLSTTASSSANSFIANKARGSSAIISGDTLGSVLFQGYDGTNQITASQIVSVNSGTVATNRIASNLLFYTHPDSTTVSTLRMTIASTGAVTIATPDSGVGLTISGGGLTSSGTTTLSSLSAGVVQTSSAGVVSSNNGSNGQLLIGGGSAPAWANITSSGSTVSITNGANSINLEVASSFAATYDADSGSATPASGVIHMTGGSNINTSATGSTVTFNLNNSPSVSGSVTAGTGFTATTGGLTVTAGSTTLTPLAAARAGIVKSSTAGVLSALIDSNTAGQILISSATLAPAWANITSSGSTITITNGSNSINLETSTSSGLLHVLHTDSGDATVSSGALTLSGGSNITTSGSGSTATVALVSSPSVSGSITAGTGLTVTTGGITSTGTTTLSSLGVGVMQTSSAGVVSSSNGTNGQVLIGGGTAPTWSTITAGSNISVTNGANSITIAATGLVSFTWQTISTTSVTMASQNGYILNNSSLVTATLPTTANVGDIISIVGQGAGGWLLAQNSSQLIHFSSATTTTGTGGSLASTNQYDCVDIICIVANTTFSVRSAVGNLTVV